MHQPDITLLGDFNLPNISWPDQQVKASSTSENMSAKMLLEFANKNFLSQIVNKPTREQNTLDLILSNSANILQEVTSDKIKSKTTVLSDHNLVETPLSPNSMLSFQAVEKTQVPPKGFRALNLEKANFVQINKDLAEVDWAALKADASLESFPAILNKTILDICKKHCPTKASTDGKQPKRKSVHGRHLHALNRRKRRLKGKLNALSTHNPSSPKIPGLKQKIRAICFKIRDTVAENLRIFELETIKKLKSNPKSFYSFVKKKSKTNSLINLLINKEGQILTKSKDIANLFQTYFCSVFSKPDCPLIKQPNFTTPNTPHPYKK